MRDARPTVMVNAEALTALRATLWNTKLGLPQIFTGAGLLASSRAAAGPGPVQRIAVLGTLTTDLIAKALACAVFREGTFPLVYGGLYGAYVQEILDPSSALHAFAPEAVLIAPDWRDAVTALPLGAEAADAERAVMDKADLFAALWNALQHAGCTIFQHVLVPPPHAYRGIAERFSPASEAAQVARLTSELFERGRGVVNWIETDRLASTVGTARWAPARYHVNGKLPFDPQHLPLYLRAVGGAWRAANARAKKVLVLDLDNTLWGGVIGDDGVANIKLGPDTPAGEAFADWGAYVKGLAQRGVVLAVCSKNDPAIAASAFDHPHAALRVSDFAAFECSWDNKVAGLHRIAAKLNLGVDSFVFADDNPAECDLVRQELPTVGVVELGADPTAFVDLLEAEHWFDVPRYTRDDVARSTSYAARRAAEEERAAAPDIDRYLAALEMTGVLYEAGESDLARIAQLEQKTNQFNVTTRRYGEAQVRDFAARRDSAVLAFTLRDRHGDHGLVSSVIAVRDGDALRIDSWLMSCRVFSRTAEDFIMERLAAIARARGARKLVGEYLPTEKNGVIRTLYARFGFAPRDDAGRMWELDLEAASPAFRTHVADGRGGAVRSAAC